MKKKRNIIILIIILLVMVTLFTIITISKKENNKPKSNNPISILSKEKEKNISSKVEQEEQKEEDITAEQENNNTRKSKTEETVINSSNNESMANNNQKHNEQSQTTSGQNANTNNNVKIEEKPKTVWEQLGISEYDYYNSPAPNEGELAVFMPFRVQEIHHKYGIYYGENSISKNMIIADRRELLNGNSFILGVSGSGKSFTAKNEIISIALRDPNADIILIDPEREYSKLTNRMNGQTIKISATSENHINPLDMNADYGDGSNPIILKSEFILSLCEHLIGSLTAKEKSIIDRCTAKVYRSYQQGNYQGVPPTLQDFREELLKQPEEEAEQMALSIELYTNGSLNTFAKNTNVNINNRIVCYDIIDLGKQLLPFGMLVILDSILNRIITNRNKGRTTYIFIDEIYLLFQHEYSANFLFTLWKRVRKYGAYCTGITQNVDDLLQSHTARTMLANSEFIVMLNQATTDRMELAKLLSISEAQLGYITDVKEGHGLLKIGSALVPFVSEFPKNTKLYKLMTTKPGEGE